MTERPRKKKRLDLDYKETRIVYLLEVVELNGEVIFFGREGASSFCGFIKNLCETVYLRLKDGFTGDDLSREFVEMIAPSLDVSFHDYHIKMVEKAYAFERLELPSKQSYLQVTSKGAVLNWARHNSGRCYTRVYGTTSRRLDQLLLDKKIRLPGFCKLKVEPLTRDKRSTSCTTSLLITDIEPCLERQPSEAHWLVVSALELCFTNKCLSSFSMTAKLRVDGEYKNQEEIWHRKSSVVGDAISEADCLTALVTAIAIADPDILLGHNIRRDVPLLLQRLGSLNIDCNQLGRILQRTYPDNEYGKTCQQREVFCGRVVIDLLVLCKDMQVPCRDEELSSLFEAILGTGAAQVDTVNQLFLLESGLGGISLVFQLAKITAATPANVAKLGRAHRVEKMLAAEFNAEQFILPEYKYKHFKPLGSGFIGGLVLEPEKQVLRDHTLLLDYMSMYPNLIIQHQVCFTSPELHPAFVPGSSVPNERLEAVLPGLMSRLLAERRTVSDKALKATSEVTKRLWETRGKALKMTANSIYGCLGSTAGRFSAVNLARHIAERGRTLLRETVSLIETLGFTVVYGDTDSVIIKANTTDTAKSLRLAAEILRTINSSSKLLHMKLEAIFDRLLIVSKKNYAARFVEIPELHHKGVLLKGLIGSRKSNPLVMEQLFRNVLEAVWSDGTEQLRLLVICLNKFRASLPSTPPSQMSASHTLNRELENYVALPTVALIAKRLIEEEGVLLGKGDSLEILPVVQHQAVQGVQYTLGQVEKMGLEVDIQTWMSTYILPALRQVTVGVSSFIPPLQLTQLVSFLGLSSSKYSLAEPLPAPKEAKSLCRRTFFPLQEANVNKEHVSVLCPMCAWSVPLNAGGYNKSKRAFTLERCQNFSCSWRPYLDQDYLVRQLMNTVFIQAKLVGFEKCGPQISILRDTFQVPKGLPPGPLADAYIALNDALNKMLALYSWGGQDLSYGKMIAQRMQIQPQ